MRRVENQRTEDGRLMTEKGRRFMIIRSRAIVFLTVFFACLISSGSALAGPNYSVNVPHKAAHKKLKAESKRPIRTTVDRHTGVPSSVSVKIPIDVSKVPQDAARRFIERHKDYFKIKDPAKELQYLRTKTDSSGVRHVRFKQEHRGIPVFGGEFIVHMDSEGVVLSINGKYLPDIILSTIPRLSSDASVKAAKEDLGDLTAKILSVPELMVFDPGLITKEEREDHLVWKLTLGAEEPPGEWVYFVDAQNGKTLFRYNSIDESQNRETYTSNNALTLPGTLWMTETWTSPDADAVALAAHENMGMTYDFYYDNFGRDSLDHAGQTLVTSVHYGSNICNSYWSTSREQVYFGDGNGTSCLPGGNSLDIVAHELTHGVDAHEANLVSGSTETGALNESFPDILGEFAEFYQTGTSDWLHGVDTYVSLNGNRDLADPTSKGHPDHYFDFLVGGDSHINCGVFNKSAYLISEGGSFNTFTINGIGWQKTGQIYYDALVNYVTSTSGLQDARDAVLASAEAGYGVGSAEAHAVIDAFNAIGIGDDMDNDGLIDIIESGTGIYNPDNKKFDAGTDRYDPDSDNDGLWDGDEVITYGTDPLVPDSDGDGLVDGEESLIFGTNPVSQDTDRDGLPDDEEIYYYHTDPLIGKLIMNNQEILIKAGVSDGDPSIRGDSSGNMHIIWEDDANESGELYYAKLDNNGNILIADKQITNSGADFMVDFSLAVDQIGNLHVVWSDNQSRTSYTKLDNNGNTLISDSVIVSSRGKLSIAVDPSDNLHIVYQNGQIVYYKKLDNNGGILVGDIPLNIMDGNLYFPALAIDTSGDVHVAWNNFIDIDDGAIYYKKLDNSGNTLIDEILITNSQATIYSRPAPITADASGNIHIAWQALNSETYYTKLDNSGNTIVDDKKVSTGPRPDLDVDLSGDLHMAWNGISYMMFDNNGDPLTSKMQISSTGNEHDLVVDPLGNIHIAWTESSSEIYYNNIMKYDSDLDNLVDSYELIIGTDPNNMDSDNDGMNDGWEEKYGFNPLDPADAALDLDGDGLSNLQEIENLSDPTKTDTDNDGLNDADEVNIYGTKAYYSDSDWDGLLDGEEVNNYGTEPGSSDTDGDGFDDGYEIASGSNPLDPQDFPAWADGDINADGKVDIADVLLAQRIAAGIVAPNQAQLSHGDMAPPGVPDGAIDVADVLLIMRMAWGLL